MIHPASSLVNYKITKLFIRGNLKGIKHIHVLRNHSACLGVPFTVGQIGGDCKIIGVELQANEEKANA